MLNDDFAQAHEIANEEGRETRHLQQVGMRVARLI
jgi:cardiolipin synthase